MRQEKARQEKARRKGRAVEVLILPFVNSRLGT
jgi:hypothetical protein